MKKAKKRQKTAFFRYFYVQISYTKAVGDEKKGHFFKKFQIFAKKCFFGPKPSKTAFFGGQRFSNGFRIGRISGPDLPVT